VTGETTTYNYDTSNRLHQVTITGGGNPRTYTYGYDNAGNRTTTSVTGTSPSSQTLSFNNANQITTAGYSYDGSGDLTASPGQTATFNAAGQQTSVAQGNVTISYTYTYAGTSQNELLSESTPGGSTYDYAYGRPDSNGQLEIESVTDNGSTGYVLHDPSGQPVMLQTSSGVTCLYLYNGIGNPIGLSTSASTTSVALQYDPYGAATRTDDGGNNGGWTENLYRFQGGLQDRATGQVKFGQRWYSPPQEPGPSKTTTTRPLTSATPTDTPTPPTIRSTSATRVEPISESPHCHPRAQKP
jgi:hypothetical protein